MIEKLEYLGLDESESKIYLALLSQGESTVGKLATILKCDRASLYRTAKKIVNLGLATTTFSNPIVYVATPPGSSIPKLIQRKEEELTALRKIGQEIIFDLEQTLPKIEEKKISYFNVVQGRQIVFEKISDLMDRAVNPVYIVTPIEDIIKMNYSTIPDKITQRVREGLQIRIITQTNSENMYSFIENLHPSEIRLGKLISQSRIVVENESQLIMSDDLSNNTDSRGKDESTLYTNSLSMISNIYRLCEHLWKTSKPLVLSTKNSTKSQKSRHGA